MADVADDDDIDLETLQAQVDVSMAYTENLVSSWMKSSEGELPSSGPRRNEEKELEEYMRRPPRLGVGAAVPESTSLLSRDTARLKNKLAASSGKKRLRDDAQHAVVVLSDDEDESRASIIKKKARVDPFEKKGKRKKAQKDQPNAPSTSTTSHGPVPTLDKQKSYLGAVSIGDSSSESTLSGTHITLLSDAPARKSKKRKRKHRDETAAIDLTGSPAAQTSELPLPAAPTVLAHDEGQRVASASHQIRVHNQLRVDSTNKGRSPSVISLSSEKSSIIMKHSLFTESGPSVSGSRANPYPRVPLLNLHGPPGETEAVEASSKKRRRKKKKKKPLLEATPVEVLSDN
ncbi:uncharacterized protein FIBRA_07793 [Fibroporia radiculosa]|uniref:Uncharacterized protein n=1 Tax=Fibroporia radiculosa TaxID=599839 RepID=J4IC04_9APHY|nr:uncharacterized protein FIBRA_07793 [Fibroporia radiculosa]CCM05566.1 predicted protein [Fibroporia radiculosa]